MVVFLPFLFFTLYFIYVICICIDGAGFWLEGVRFCVLVKIVSWPFAVSCIRCIVVFTGARFILLDKASRIKVSYIYYGIPFSLPSHTYVLPGISNPLQSLEGICSLS